MNWWHWIENIWLLIDPDERFDAARIRDKLRAMKSSKRCIEILTMKHGLDSDHKKKTSSIGLRRIGPNRQRLPYSN
jgi:hypothetical protein